MLHLIKLCVGADSVSDLEDWQKDRLKQMKKAGQKPELMHITRQMPKRRFDLLEGGSLYWVIKGHIAARQELLDLRAITRGGVPHCGLVLAPEVIRVAPRPHRAFQGWRYFDPKDAPRDLASGQAGEMPEEMLRELTELGLF